jgi:hypothetical protein
MMRADEVEAGERVRHAITGEIVTVTGRRDMLTRTKIGFKAKGMHGWFTVPPHYELEEM